MHNIHHYYYNFFSIYETGWKYKLHKNELFKPGIPTTRMYWNEWENQQDFQRRDLAWKKRQKNSNTVIAHVVPMLPIYFSSSQCSSGLSGEKQLESREKEESITVELEKVV